MKKVFDPLFLLNKEKKPLGLAKNRGGIMTFSIIIPVYQVEKYLKQRLESVLNQNFKDYEVILIDDGSTDNSGKICDDYA